MARKRLIQLRGDTAANWAAADPVLADREPGYETDTGILRVGDGTTAWSALPQIGADLSALPEVADSENILIDTDTPGLVKPVRFLYVKQGKAIAVSNTAAETSLLDSPLNIASGVIRDNGTIVNLKGGGVFTNNSGNPTSFTCRVSCQGNVIFTFGVSGITADSDGRPWRFNMDVRFAEFAGVRAFGFGEASLGSPGLTDIGEDFASMSFSADTFGHNDFDLSEVMDFDITVEHGDAHASISTQLVSITAEPARIVTS